MKFHTKEVLNDVWMQFLVLCLLTALSVDSLKCVSRSLRIHRGLCGLLTRSVALATPCTARSRP